MRRNRRLVNEDDKKQDKKEAAPKVKDPKKAILAGLRGMKPGFATAAVADQLGTGVVKFLGSHLLDIIINAAKNGKVKAAALKDAIKDFDVKNVEDNSGIDWDKVELDESGITLKCLFDGDSMKKLDAFAKDCLADLKDVGEEAKKTEDQYKADVKKAGIKVDEDSLNNDSLVIASVMDDKKNKGKSGKELTKEVKTKIEASNKIAEMAKKTAEATKKVDAIKLDPKIANMDPKELDKKIQVADKKAEKSNKGKGGNPASKMSIEIKNEIKKKVSSKFKKNVHASVFKTESFMKSFNDGGFGASTIKLAIKTPYVIAARFDYLDKEAEEVLGEKDTKPGYKVNPLKGNEKNKAIKKITDYAIEAINKVAGADNIEKISKFRKRWAGDNPDGNLDQIYVVGALKTLGDEKLDENEPINEKTVDVEVSHLKGFNHGMVRGALKNLGVKN